MLKQFDVLATSVREARSWDLVLINSNSPFSVVKCWNSALNMPRKFSSKSLLIQ
jgi:hypothetical protein